jgi:putative membrane protein
MLAIFIFRGLQAPDSKKWIPAFALSGFVAMVTGLYMTFTWPMPGVNNIAFGELSVMIGVLLLGAAWCIGKSWSFFPLSVYAVFASIAAVVIGIQFIHLQIDQNPDYTGVAFILVGLGGVLALPTTFFYSRNPKLSRVFQWAAIILLIVGGAILAGTGYKTYWDHMSIFSKYAPS